MKLKKVLILRWAEIEEIMQRSCYGPQNGVEIYTCTKKHYSFNLLKQENARSFIELIEKIKKGRSYDFDIITDPVKTFENMGFADSWKNGEKSN